jgi:hypothetical protein
MADGLLNKASIILTPTGYKAGTLYNVAPVVEPYEDFDFARASVASRVNSSGLVEMVGRTLGSNLVQNGDFSELGSELVTNGDFATDSDWTKGTGWSIGDGKATSIGSNYGQQLKQTILQTNKIYKLSFDIVDYTSGNIALESIYYGVTQTFNGIGSYVTYFTSLSQTEFRLYSQNFIGSIDNVSVKQVDPNDYWTLGSGWSIEDGKASNDGSVSGNSYLINSPSTAIIGKTYKVEFTISNYTQGNIRVRAGQASSVFITANGNFIQYMVATSTETCRIQAQNNFIGSIENVSVKEIIDTNNIPRISYDSNGDNGHILLEPTSTNKYTYSNDFEQWQSSGSITINSNFATSPDGTQNASRLQWTNATNFIYQSLSHIGNDHTLSIYMKSNTASSQSVRLFMDNGAQGQDANVTTEWQRFTFSNSSATTQSNRNVGLIKSGTQVGDLDILIAFAQFEALSYATSYIPTLTGSQEVRATETATGAGSADLINSTEGVLYAEIAALVEVDAQRRFITLNDGTSSNGVILRYESTGVINARYQISGIAQASISHTTTITNTRKIAFKYKQNDFALWVDGVEVGTDNSGSVLGANTINNIDFHSGNGAFSFYGKVKAITVFNTALTDAELTELTS